MNRREFAKGLGAALVAAHAANQAAAQTPAGGATPTLYYVDGYHGGSRGHMPAGSWRDILNAMRAIPEWKISLDIEPASWDDLRREDPAGLSRVSKAARRSRRECPRGNGERHVFAALRLGARRRKQHSPTPARARDHPRSISPMRSLKPMPCRNRAGRVACRNCCARSDSPPPCLKNPGTAWGGYAAGFDAETVDWVGPDGTSIAAVPRYACEELVRTWETESVTGSAEFSRKCAANGIAHPAGNCFQDLGWAARPEGHGRAHPLRHVAGVHAAGGWTSRKSSGASARKIS